MVYSKQGLKILATDKHKDSNFNQFAEFLIQTKGDPLNVILFYRPPSSGRQNIDELCNIMENTSKNTLLIGDLNMPGISWGQETAAGPRERAVLDVACKAGLHQLVDFATHRKGNILDVVLTNCNEKIISVVESGVIGRSDHSVITVELELQPIRKSNHSRRPNWSKADRVGIKNHLASIDWKNEVNKNCVESNWQIFKDHLIVTVEKFVPSSTVRAQNQPKWLNRDILKMIRRKKNAWKTWKSPPTPHPPKPTQACLPQRGGQPLISILCLLATQDSKKYLQQIKYTGTRTHPC